jgi:hypothetical protein
MYRAHAALACVSCVFCYSSQFYRVTIFPLIMIMRELLALVVSLLLVHSSAAFALPVALTAKAVSIIEVRISTKLSTVRTL